MACYITAFLFTWSSPITRWLHSWPPNYHHTVQLWLGYYCVCVTHSACVWLAGTIGWPRYTINSLTWVTLRHDPQASKHNCIVYTPVHQARLAPTQTKLKELMPKTNSKVNQRRSRKTCRYDLTSLKPRLFVQGNELWDVSGMEVLGLRLDQETHLVS